MFWKKKKESTESKGTSPLSQDLKAEKFWNWFIDNQSKFMFLAKVDSAEREKLLEEFKYNLHAFNNNLFFEIGGHPDAEKIELVITAEGIIEYFPAVEFLVEKSPELNDWQILAFKPPMGNTFTIKYGGVDFDPNKIIFIPLHSDEAPDAVALRVFYPEFTETEKNLFINGTFLIMDVILGEKSTALDIAHLDVAQTPENITDFDFMHLSSLKEYLDEKRRLTE